MRQTLSRSLLTLVLIAAPAFAETKVLCLGDSLTEGYGVAKEAAWPALVEAELKTKGHQDVVLVNAGVSGSTTSSGLSRLKWHLNSPSKPKILILALGANDGLRGLDLKTSKQQLLDVVRLAKQNNVQVLLAGMLIPPNYGKAYTDEFQKMYVDIAKDEKIERIPFLLEGVAGDPSLNQADGIHPTEKGYKIVAATVLKHLTQMLAK